MKVANNNYYATIQCKNKSPDCSFKFQQMRFSVSFKSRDLLDLPEKDVFNRISESLTPENFIGQGTDAEVYHIKDTEYCVRIPYGAQDIYRFSYTKELTPADKVNHIVAKLGFGSTIMRYFSGVTPKRYMSNSIDRYKFQAQIAQMPLKSYTDFLNKIANGINNEMVHDFSGGNLIVNFEKNTLTPIDFSSIFDTFRDIKPLTEMYSVLTCYGTEESVGKKIFDKIILASLEEFEPGKIPCMDVELFDYTNLVMKRNADIKLKEGNVGKSIQDFLSLKDNINKAEKSIKEIKKDEIIKKDLAPLLKSKIAEFKSLILQVR